MSVVKKWFTTLKAETNLPFSKVNSSYMKLVELLPLQTISNKQHHATALKVIESLMSHINASNHHDKGAEIYLKTLSELVHDYERENYKTMAVSGRDMLAYLMELQGLTQMDLAKEVGGQSVISKILTGERELNLRQIKALAKRFHVSPEVFI